jgi:hypothetical protein
MTGWALGALGFGILMAAAELGHRLRQRARRARWCASRDRERGADPCRINP